MAYISSDDAREQVRQATDIVELIGSYLELRRQGRNYVARCPWHDDSRPSLQINQERQSWKCWVCAIGGDVFSFLMKREAIGFREALQMLAEKAGIQITQQKQAPVEPGSPDDKTTLYQAAAWAEKQFHDCLLNSPAAEAARRYLDERGISEESISRFNIGYLPDERNWIRNKARNTSFSLSVLEAIDLISKSEEYEDYYERLKGRVIFPIYDLQNRPIAFGGRVLPGYTGKAGKYLNSRETRLFSKSDNLYAFNLVRDLVAKTKSIIIVEGYTDVIIAHQSGLKDVVAVLGTALNERHIKLLRRFVDTVYLVLDGDDAGQKRTKEILELFVGEQMDLRIMTLPDGKDPADFLLEGSAEDFRKLLSGAVDALEHRIRTSTVGIDLKRDTHKANEALEDILATISKAPRGVSITESAHRLREQQILVRLSREFSLPEATLQDRIDEIRKGKSKTPAPIENKPDETNDENISLSLSPQETELLQIFSMHPELVPMAFDFVGEAHLPSPTARNIFEAYRQLHEAGEPAVFHSVMAMLESPRMKSFLVELDDEAHAKSEVATEPPESRMRQLIDHFRMQDELQERRQNLVTLEQKSLPTTEEDDLLKHLFDLEKLRRGISAPMDGSRPQE